MIRNTTSDPAAGLSHQNGSMNTPGESLPQEARGKTDSLLGTKTKLRMGAWNVRTLFETGRKAQVIKEMRRYKLDILGISECRWTGTGSCRNSDGSVMIYSGHRDEHIRGVAVIVSKEKCKSILEWEPISDRLLKIRFNSQQCKLTVLQCYAPTEDSDEAVKDDFYDLLERTVSKVPRHDMLMIMGDLNAKVGSDNTHYERAIGKQGCGVMNDNGERLVNFCMDNNLFVGGTFFHHKDIHKLTWVSPDGFTRNQIDHIIMNSKWRRSLEDVRVCRGADVYSDHYLVTAVVKLKLRKTKQENQGRRRLDIDKLKCPATKKEFSIELKNRFCALENDPIDDIENRWEVIKASYANTAAKVLGYKKRQHKNWISQTTLQKIEERQQLRCQLLSSNSPRLKAKFAEAYKAKNTEVKKNARKDKRSYVNQLAEEAERAASHGDMSTVYRITKQLCGKSTNDSGPIRATNGEILTTERQQTHRWMQHFENVLNHADPENPPTPEEPQVLLDIDVSVPTEPEVRSAIKAMKSGKAAGIDSIHAEMLQADIDTSSQVFTALFKSIWENEVIPRDWDKGLIVKLPKKGDRKDCDNWRGITILSIPSKVFCKILLGRINSAIDSRLRPEQAGFRKGRGCIDQIFALRNIIEQSIEWNSSLHINFIDFKKAFDSVHRETVWKILGSYGVPSKMVTLMKLFYLKFECSVIVNGNTRTDWFSVKSGVRQGCILSPILFLVVIDWVMRQTTSDRPRGIQWTLFSQIEDLDFADDLAVLSSTHRRLQEKTDRLVDFSKSTGLVVNSKKTEVMALSEPPHEPITISGEPLRNVEDFTYLGSVVSTDNAAQKDILARLGKARSAFARLQPIWKSQQYTLRTKLRVYNRCCCMVQNVGES